MLSNIDVVVVFDVVDVVAAVVELSLVRYPKRPQKNKQLIATKPQPTYHEVCSLLLLVRGGQAQQTYTRCPLGWSLGKGP